MLYKDRKAHCPWPCTFVYKLVVIFCDFCSILWGYSEETPRVKVILASRPFLELQKDYCDFWEQTALLFIFVHAKAHRWKQLRFLHLFLRAAHGTALCPLKCFTRILQSLVAQFF